MARRAEPALAEVTQALDAVAGTGQERFAGWLACLGARALADLAEQARARQDPAAAADAHRHRRMLTRRLTEIDSVTRSPPARPSRPAPGRNRPSGTRS